MQKNQFAHHVFFWLKNSESAEDRDALMEGLQKMSAISTIRQYQIGLPVRSDRAVVDSSWSVSWLNIFDSAEDEATYQAHPIHMEFVKNCSHLWKKVVVYNAVG